MGEKEKVKEKEKEGVQKMKQLTRLTPNGNCMIPGKQPDALIYQNQCGAVGLGISNRRKALSSMICMRGVHTQARFIDDNAARGSPANLNVQSRVIGRPSK